MIRYLLRRVLWGVLVVWVVATSVFIIYFAVPHDVARLIAFDVRRGNGRRHFRRWR